MKFGSHATRSKPLRCSYLLIVLGKCLRHGAGIEDRTQEKGKPIENETENRWTGLLSLLGLFSGLLASLNQLLRLWDSKTEADRDGDTKAVSEALEALELEVKSIREALTRLEAEKDC